MVAAAHLHALPSRPSENAPVRLTVQAPNPHQDVREPKNVKIIGSKKDGVFQKCPIIVQRRNPQNVKNGN
jgi:hypothetical protein